MKRTSLLISILVVSVSLTAVYFLFDVFQNEPWNGLSCEEMFDFAMSPEHKDLTIEQHMKFHKVYDDLCIQNKPP